MERLIYIMRVIEQNELAKDAAYGSATMLGGVLLFITENPEWSLVIFVASFIPVLIRLYHSTRERKEKSETHKAEMKLLDLETKIKERQLNNENEEK